MKLLLFALIFSGCVSASKKDSLNKKPFVFSYATDLTEKNWLSAEHGRTVYLFGTTISEKIKKFIPSGRKPEEKRIGKWKIILRPPVYYSDQENPDTSKDKPASVIVHSLETTDSNKTAKQKTHFVAKGYKFSIIPNPKMEKDLLFIIRYWPGVMGCTLIDFSFFQDPESKDNPLIEYRSTRSITDTNKIGELCKPSTSFLFLLN